MLSTIARSGRNELHSGINLVKYLTTSTPRNTQRILLITDFRTFTSDQQYAPLERYRTELRRAFGLNSVVQSHAATVRLGANFVRSFDVVGFKYSFQRRGSDVIAAMDEIRAMATGHTRFVYFDGDDDPNIQWVDALERVDVYVKKHALRDRSQYGRRFLGKSNLTDYLARGANLDVSQLEHPESGPVPAQLIPRIQVGWNIALDDKIHSLYKRITPYNPLQERQFDVCGRALYKKGDWIGAFREPLQLALRQMSNEMRVADPTVRLPPAQYYEEMRRSKICVSPFGYGEICYRDFEAILSGCMLIKPDMSHIETQPDIFQTGITYVPVRWDYSDLREKCDYYLNHSDEREVIAKNAFETVSRALSPEWIADKFRVVL